MVLSFKNCKALGDKLVPPSLVYLSGVFITEIITVMEDHLVLHYHGPKNILKFVLHNNYSYSSMPCMRFVLCCC